MLPSSHCWGPTYGRTCAQQAAGPLEQPARLAWLDLVQELLHPHETLLQCTAVAAAGTTATPAAVLETGLAPYTLPVQPLSLFDTARESDALPCQSDWHSSVLMRLSWPPGCGVALPLGWRGLGLLQIAALKRGYITRRMLDCISKAMATGEARDAAAAALPPWDGPGRSTTDSSLAAGVVRMSGVLPRQSLLNGVRLLGRLCSWQRVFAAVVLHLQFIEHVRGGCLKSETSHHQHQSTRRTLKGTQQQRRLALTIQYSAWLSGFLRSACCFVPPCCGFPLSLFCNYHPGCSVTEPLL